MPAEVFSVDVNDTTDDNPHLTGALSCRFQQGEAVFRADERFGVEVPPMLAHGVGDADYYRAVEATSHGLMWVLQVQDGSAVTELPGRWRRLLVADLGEALQLIGLDQWTARSLHVLVPPHLSPSKTMTLAFCKAVWECSEPDGDEICWRVETDQGPLLESMYGTVPGHEVRRQLLWSDAGGEGGLASVS